MNQYAFFAVAFALLAPLSFVFFNRHEEGVVQSTSTKDSQDLIGEQQFTEGKTDSLNKIISRNGQDVAVVDTDTSQVFSADSDTAEPNRTLANTESDKPSLNIELSEIDWEAAELHPKIDESGLTQEQLAAVNRSLVPVLLPALDDLRSSGVITTGDTWYASSMGDNDVSVVISASSKLVFATDMVLPELPDLETSIDNITRQEGIVEVDFKAFGTYYNLSIECYRPFTDTHCTEDGYAKELISSLLIAGGKPPSISQ